jgi:predicted nuclease of restriction endonuclease-like (RecB) superfamily
VENAWKGGTVTELTNFYTEVKLILQQARIKAQTAVNSAMIEAYWLIGRRIVEEEQQGEKKAKYGERLLENLSKELSNEFGRGFSYANLRNFRQFYLTYPVQEICYTLCSKLSWSHNRLIMRIENNRERGYYLKEAIEGNWSVRQLERNIKSQSYRRLSQHRENQIKNHQTSIILICWILLETHMSLNFYSYQSRRNLKNQN